MLSHARRRRSFVSPSSIHLYPSRTRSFWFLELLYLWSAPLSSSVCQLGVRSGRVWLSCNEDKHSMRSKAPPSCTPENSIQSSKTLAIIIFSATRRHKRASLATSGTSTWASRLVREAKWGSSRRVYAARSSRAPSIHPSCQPASQPAIATPRDFRDTWTNSYAS